MHTFVESLKKQIQDLELSLRKAESEKQSKDHQIRSLQDEMAQQDENISRLNKVRLPLLQHNPHSHSPIMCIL